MVIIFIMSEFLYICFFWYVKKKFIWILPTNIARAIITKLKNAMDKHKLMSNLQVHNLARQNEQQSATTSQRSPKSIYVTEHLPKELQEKRKRLLSPFKEAKKLGKKISGAITNGFYCLYVNDKLAN